MWAATAAPELIREANQWAPHHATVTTRVFRALASNDTPR
jgi:hypothetical protein